MKDLEYIVNGIIVEDESKTEQDEARKKRMLASSLKKIISHTVGVEIQADSGVTIEYVNQNNNQPTDETVPSETAVPAEETDPSDGTNPPAIAPT